MTTIYNRSFRLLPQHIADVSALIPSLRMWLLPICTVLLGISISHAENTDKTDSIRMTQRDRLEVKRFTLPDTIAASGDSIYSYSTSISSSTKFEKVNPELKWYQRLAKNNFNFKDTTIVYPKFIGFCVDVYNWADRVFNSYDEDYVAGTGRRWKAYIKNDNWLDSYAMNFDGKMTMRMMSNVTANVGPYLQYMAVSLGYSWDMSNLIGGRPINRKRLDFGFSCARFSADMYYWNSTGGNVIRTFGKFNNGHLIALEMPGVTMSSFGLDIYYFLNNRRYSQIAAYGYGKIQKRSAGSFIFGFTYSNDDFAVDFDTLPAVLVPYLTIAQRAYHFHYNNYCLMAGYGYNLVFAKKWLFNVTVIPSFGVNHCFEDSEEGTANLFSLNVKGRLSLVYNHKDFFIGANGKMDGHWFRSGNYSLFNAMETLSASVGWRF